MQAWADYLCREVLGIVINASHVIGGAVRQLALDGIGIPTQLVQQSAGGSPKTAGGHLGAQEAALAQGMGEGLGVNRVPRAARGGKHGGPPMSALFRVQSLVK
jgi:hypothetical protein